MQGKLKNLVFADTMTIGEYLKLENAYKIPYSQRNYEWGRKEIERFFDDVYKIFKTNDKNKMHMFNVITILNGNHELLIYDGQQRTITGLLLLAAVAKMTKKTNEELSDELTDDYICKNSVLRDNERKLTFDSDIDTKFFYNMIDRNNEEKDLDKEKSGLDKNSNRKAFIDGYLILLKKLENLKLTGNQMTEFVESFINNCFLVELLVSEKEIAEKMFETLNNTGKDLEKYYVLKNDIVRKLGEDKVREKWDKIDYNLGNVSHNTFLKNFANVLIGKANKDNALDKIYEKYNINNTDDMQELLEKLYKASQYYSEIVNPNKYKGASKEVVEYQEKLYYLDAFGFKQHYAIILAMLLKQYPLRKINRVLKALLVLVVRNYYLLSEKSNKIVDTFAHLAKKIYNENLDVDLLLRSIYSYAEGNNLVKNAAINKDYTNVKRKKAIRALLIILYNNGSEELKINNEKVDLEHILPIKPKKDSDWNDTFGEEHDKYVHKLGNLTLWYGKKNRSAKNDEFAKKREEYKISELEENKAIAKNDKWTKSEINNRTKNMVEDILKVLKINK